MQIQKAVDMVATAAARLEESAYRHSVILPDFPRSIQLRIFFGLNRFTQYYAITTYAALPNLSNTNSARLIKALLSATS